MEKYHDPALTPLESAMLPAIERKQMQRQPFAALHAALDLWSRARPSAQINTAPAREENGQSAKRALSRAAYAYAVKKRKT